MKDLHNEILCVWFPRNQYFMSSKRIVFNRSQTVYVDKACV